MLYLKKRSKSEFAELISKILSENGINAVLVGGACVSIYSDNKYESLDLDYITPALTNEIDIVLKRIGFIRKKMFRQYSNNECPFYIEFPPGPVSIGEEGPITKFAQLGSIALLSTTDCVKDRLAAFIHWDDEQSLKQALLVANAQKVNLKEIKRWAIEEGREDKYTRFESLLK
jgi:hypothetical protein